MSEIMIVLMAVMLVAVFGSGHKGMMGHHGAAEPTPTRICDQNGQTGCLPPSGQPAGMALNVQVTSQEKP